VDAAEGPLSASSLMMESLMAEFPGQFCLPVCWSPLTTPAASPARRSPQSSAAAMSTSFLITSIIVANVSAAPKRDHGQYWCKSAGTELKASARSGRFSAKRERQSSGRDGVIVESEATGASRFTPATRMIAIHYDLVRTSGTFRGRINFAKSA
jgi:hypothetical protein